MSDPDSVVQYVVWLDRRFNQLVSAISEHRAFKSEPYDEHDLELWSNLDWAYSQHE